MKRLNFRLAHLQYLELSQLKTGIRRLRFSSHLQMGFFFLLYDVALQKQHLKGERENIILLNLTIKKICHVKREDAFLMGNIFFIFYIFFIL